MIILSEKWKINRIKIKTRNLMSLNISLKYIEILKLQNMEIWKIKRILK